ncbi:MAG TPA: murein biosynthesis protein MurJ, partial [Acidimicrobiia bacterium]
FARGMFSAAVAGGLGLLVVDRFLPEGDLGVWSALGIGLVGGLTTLAAFLAISALLRAPEMREVLPGVRK